MAKTKNPVLKLINALKDAERLTDAIVNLSDQEIVSSVKNLKEVIKPNSDTSFKTSAVVKSIMALLSKYPGFESEVLSNLKNRISAAEKLEILDKYKTIFPKSSFKKPVKNKVKAESQNPTLEKVV